MSTEVENGYPTATPPPQGPAIVGPRGVATWTPAAPASPFSAVEPANGQFEPDPAPRHRRGWSLGALWLWIGRLIHGTRRREPSRPDPLGAQLGKANWSELVLFGKPNPGLMASFCRQFSVYLESGVTLVRTLTSLRRQFSGTALGPAIGRIADSARRGDTLTDAFSRDGETFDHMFRTMMRVGETRGAVPETLQMLSEHYTSRQRLQRQVRSSLIYPAFVVLGVIGVGIFLTMYVLPYLIDILEDMIKHGPKRYRNMKLPWPTRALMSMSHFARTIGWWLVPTVAAGLVIGTILFYKLPAGKAVLDAIVLRLPIIGRLLRKSDMSRFSRTLSVLLSAGIDINSSLELTSDVMTLVPLKRSVRRANESVRDGGTLGAGLRASHHFPMELLTVVESGEETGRLPEILLPLADDYDDQVEHMVRDLGSLIQPLIVVVLGGLVAFVVIGFVMGYTTVLDKLSGS